MRLLVVGGGVAGSAAVHAALARGLECVWALGAAGASHASTGALDWDQYGGASEPTAGEQETPPELREFGSGRFGWRFGDSVSWVSTAEGSVRAARGVDAGVLDLAGLAGKRVAVVGLAGEGRGLAAGWDAAWMRRSLVETEWAVRSHTAFDELPLDLEAATFAEGADEERREQLLAVLRQTLERAPERPDALLFGPWLALSNDVTTQLSAALGVAVGECLSPPYGAAGERFEAARAAIEQADGVEVLRGEVRRVVVEDERVVAWFGERTGPTAIATKGAATTASKDADGSELHVDACVLAIGGLVGGGVVLDDRQQLRPSVEIAPPAALWMNGRVLLDASAAFGLDVSSVGVSALQRVGLGPGLGTARLSWAGDATADAPRTVLRAAQSGLDAVTRLLP